VAGNGRGLKGAGPSRGRAAPGARNGAGPAGVPCRMTIPPSIAEIDDKAGVQRRIWAVSGVGRWIMAGLLVLAAGGLFGHGPLSRAEAEVPDGSLRASYHRFQRAEAGFLFALRTTREAGDGTVTLCLDGAFNEEWTIERFEPASLRQEARGTEVCHALLVAPSDTPSVIRLLARPRTSGWHEGGIRLGQGEGLRVRVLVWP